MQQMTTEEIRASQIGILNYIASLCQENHLTYFISSGTLIGAVRHKGYIPWDDDIDMFMKRDDYQKLVQIMNVKDEGQRYVLMSLQTNPDYYYPYAKVVDRKTAIVESYMRQIPGDGVWIDIFPMDYYDEKLAMPFDQLIRLNQKHRLAAQKKVIPSGKRGRDLLKRLLHLYYRMRNPRKMALKIEEISQCTKEKTSQLYLGLSPFGDKDLYSADWFADTVEVTFEGNTYTGPAGYDAYLSHRFGNYMCLPPENQRVSNHSYTAYWRSSEK